MATIVSNDILIFIKSARTFRRGAVEKDNLYTIAWNKNQSVRKGRFHLRFSGIRPLRGFPPPPLLTENQSEKKKVFSLAERGGTPPPLTESPLSFSGKFFSKRAKKNVFFIK